MRYLEQFIDVFKHAEFTMRLTVLQNITKVFQCNLPLKFSLQSLLNYLGNCAAQAQTPPWNVSVGNIFCDI